MERRKFLIGAGGTAIGASALIGSGAFTRVSAERSVTVQATGDASAFLRLTPNGQYAHFNGNDVLELSFDQINPSADVEFYDVFNIENQGDEPVGIFLDEGSQSYAFNNDAEQPSEAGSDGMYDKLADQGFPQNGWFDDDITDDPNGPECLPSAYRPSTINDESDRGSVNPSKPHVIDVGESLSPDWYIFDTPSDPDSLDITGKLVILAFTQDYVDAGKGP